MSKKMKIKLSNINKRMKNKRKLTSYSVRVKEKNLEIMKLLREDGYIENYSELIQVILDEYFYQLKLEYGDELPFIKNIPISKKDQGYFKKPSKLKKKKKKKSK